jgi:hypothetical protein
MDISYLVWAFKRSSVVTLLYSIACWVIWQLLGSASGWIAFVLSAVTWVMYFSVYVKDPRTDKRYYHETRIADE